MSTGSSGRLQNKTRVSRMPDVLGVDTSNYTTSAAIWRNGEIIQQKKLLPVREGELGLRQSDAVFHHVRQLPEVLDALPFADAEIACVGVSSRPRDQEGSYMPCFLAGCSVAKAVSLACHAPLFTFSHQKGHIAAALYSAGRLSLLAEPFLAFHVSGGTTEAVLVRPDPERILHTELVAQSLDLKGGQAVDRVGKMLGLSFPSGPALERLAEKSDARFSLRPCLKGADCSLSGIENQCSKMLSEGRAPEDVASFCLQSILAALDGMAEVLLKSCGKLPLVFAGGVMSNGMIRKALTEKYGAFFAAPEFSSDNAAGVALLAAVKGGMFS